MKNLLLATFALFSFAAYSQSHDYNAVLYFASKTPIDTVYTGDSINIYYSIDIATFKPEQRAIIQLIPNWFANQSNPYSPKFTLYSDTSAGYKARYDASKGFYFVKVLIPANADTGTARILQPIYNGSLFSIYIKKRTSIPTGIINHKNEGKIIDTRYFDLGGAELTAPVPNQLIIKVDMYEDGSFKSTKSITVL